MSVPPLFHDRIERDRLEDLATFYSIIKATEHLERGKQVVICEHVHLISTLLLSVYERRVRRR